MSPRTRIARSVDLSSLTRPLLAALTLPGGFRTQSGDLFDLVVCLVADNETLGELARRADGVTFASTFCARCWVEWKEIRNGEGNGKG
jgi:hypothetical protein